MRALLVSQNRRHLFVTPWVYFNPYLTIGAETPRLDARPTGNRERARVFLSCWQKEDDSLRILI
jgi:hypothetical protein